VIDAREWLASRTPAPPPELALRLAELTADRECSDLKELSGILVDQAVNVLAAVSDDRSGAFDLLVADSLITYALEAASEDCAHVESVAADTMRRVASVAGREAKP
jgi:hypothetical protein